MIDPTFLSQVLKDINGQIADPVASSQVTPMGDEPGDAVSDNPDKFWVRHEGDAGAGVLFISNEANPQFMARAVTRGESARRVLSPKSASVIVPPVCRGEVDGRSFVLYPRERALSSNRLRRYVQKKLLVSEVVEWTIRVAEETAGHLERSERESSFADALQSLSEREAFQGGEISSACDAARDRLRSGLWTPMTVLAHNDLWMDNVLLRNESGGAAGETYPFVIIDWAGAKTKGYPFYDLVRFMMSAGIKPSLAGVYLQIYCELMKCEALDALGYVLASLGDLGGKLEAFPEARYVALVKECHAYLAEAIR